MEMPGGADLFQLEIGRVGLDENKLLLIIMKLFTCSGGDLQLSHTAWGNSSRDRVISGAGMLSWP